MKKIFSKELIIGVCVLVALVLLFGGIEFLKGINLLTPTNSYYASYNNVQGLEIAAPVTVNGYKIGQVRDIKFNYDNPSKIDVLLALDDDVMIPNDSRAIIESGMLNGASIRIILGRSKTMLEVGSDIPTGIEDDMMSKITSDIMPKVSGILPKVDSLLYNLNVVVTNPAIYSSITRLDAITANLEGAAIGTNRLMNTHVPMLIGNAGGVVTKIDTIMSNLAVLSAQLKTLQLDSTMSNVSQITNNLAQFSSQLKSDNGTLGLLMNDPALYYKLNRVTADIDSLIIDIKRNPKRYISIKLL